MNMISRAAGAVCRWLERESGALGHHLYSGREAEKHPAAGHLSGGKGKTVVAGARLPRRVVQTVLGTTPEALGELFVDTVLGHVQAGALGHNAHVANGLTALFVATGQDVANVVDSVHAITEMGPTAPGPDGVVDLQATVTLPSLVVATVGGGTALPTSRECLSMLGCVGTAKAAKLAEIAAATVLAGELSFSASLTAGGGFVEAHETFGRNRPDGRARSET
jgi:hydroxymethylglutaryl-CoA reductase (NADPH)